MIGERFKLIRRELNLTQKAFGDLLGIPLTTVSKYETGTNKPSSDILSKLSELNININWLLTGNGSMFLEQDKEYTIDKTAVNMLGETEVKYLSDISAPSEIINSDDFSPVPFVEAELSAGGGSFLTSDNIISYYAFCKQWLRKKLINPKKAVLMRVMGDSMHPLIDDKDIVLVDLNARTLKDGKIFAIAFGESIFLKQIQFIPPDKLSLISKNTSYEPIKVQKQDIPRLHIIGQVKWLGKELD